jgi:hypothetical protein
MTMAKVKVPVFKGVTLEVDTDLVPEQTQSGQNLMSAIFALGIGVFLKRGKGAKANAGLEPAEIAAKNLADLYAGKVRLVGAKGDDKTSGKVMTEARRLAKQMMRDAIKAEGGKISHYDASEITKAANALLEADPSIIEKAKENLANAPRPKSGDALAAILAATKANPELVNKAPRKKAKAPTTEEAEATSEEPIRAPLPTPAKVAMPQPKQRPAVPPAKAKPGPQATAH